LRGGIILTLNRELVNQVHREIISLDPERRMKVHKVGSIGQGNISNDENNVNMQLKSNYPNFSDNSKNSNEIGNPYIKNLDWAKIDILVSTPKSLMNLV